MHLSALSPEDCGKTGKLTGVRKDSATNLAGTTYWAHEALLILTKEMSLFLFLARYFNSHRC